MFKDNLLKIKRNLPKANSSLKNFIQARLDCSLELYNQEVAKTCDYLLSRSNLKVIRAISAQYQKEKENENESE